MNDFPTLPFATMGEADVREEILAPLIRLLGYRQGTEFDVIREQSLRYPREFIGTKKPRTDPVLRGKADYILDVVGYACWVLEAKAPGVPIDDHAIQQAWSYANHPEVRAVYFAVSNGEVLQVFATQAGPTAGAFMSVSYEDMEQRLPELHNTLGPAAIKHAFPDQKKLAGKPLGPGLRAFARIEVGTIAYHKASFNAPLLTRSNVAITEGAIQRDEEGRLVAYVKTLATLREYQELNELLGVAEMEMTSGDGEISTDPNRPTVFENERVVVIPEGTESLSVETWEKVRMPFTMRCHVVTSVTGYMSDHVYSGTLNSVMRSTNDAGLEIPPFVVEGLITVRLR
jgi:hypothetical protein